MNSEAPSTLTLTRLLSVLTLLSFILLVVILISLNVGASRISLLDIYLNGPSSEVSKTILFDIRLPRVSAAGLLGAALAVAGVVFQALLRNPLADPYVLGVSGGASIGGLLALVAGLPALFNFVGHLAIPLCAFLGAIGSMFMIERLATINGRITAFNILLTGVIFNAFAAAIIYFIQSIASLQQLQDVVFYLMGRIPALSTKELFLLAVVVSIITILISRMGREYNTLTLGEEGAMLLGVNVESIKKSTFFIGSLLTAISVSFAGLIGFVGLIVPHILRLMIGSDHRLLIPASALSGAIFLILADLFARTVMAPNELPVGVITALIGGPFFLYLLRRNSQRYE